MAKFTCMDTNMSIEPLSDLDKIMARQPMQKLIFGDSLGFKNSSYSALKKQRKNGARIIREAYLLNDISDGAMRGKIMAIMRPSGAGKSNESFIFTREMSDKAYRASSRVISSLIAYLPLLAIQGLDFPSHFTSYAVVIAVIATKALFLKLLQIPKYLKWLINILKGTKCVKDKPEDFSPGPLGDKEISKLHNTSPALNPHWTLIEDLLFTVDVSRIDSFVDSIGILLAWGVLCLLFFFVRRFYSKNVRKMKVPHYSDF